MATTIGNEVRDAISRNRLEAMTKARALAAELAAMPNVRLNGHAKPLAELLPAAGLDGDLFSHMIEVHREHRGLAERAKRFDAEGKAVRAARKALREFQAETRAIQKRRTEEEYGLLRKLQAAILEIDRARKARLAKESLEIDEGETLGLPPIDLDGLVLVSPGGDKIGDSEAAPQHGVSMAVYLRELKRRDAILKEAIKEAGKEASVAPRWHDLVAAGKIARLESQIAASR